MTPESLSRFHTWLRDLDHLDVLLDPLADPGLVERAQTLPKQIERLHLSDPLFADAPTEAPLLLRVPGNEMERWDAWVSKAQQEATDPNTTSRSVCGFLQSPLPLERVALGLTRVLDLRVDGQGIYFRFFDPRVMFHLSRVVPEELASDWFSGLSRWMFFDWTGEWVEFKVLDRASGNWMTPCTLPTDLWRRRFVPIEHFNATVDLFRLHGLPCRPADSDLWMQQIEVAMQSGVAMPRDVAHYLACSLGQKEPLNRHPEWHGVQELLATGVPLADALSHCCRISL